MANALYPLWKQELMKGTAGTALNGSGSTGTWCALLHAGSYTYSAFHQFYVSVRSSPDAIIGTDQEIQNKVFNNGAFTGGNLTYTSVSNTNGTIDYLLIYNKIGSPDVDSAWPLVAFFDTSITGLPVTPNGGNITVTWNTGTSPDNSGIFLLSDKRAKENFVPVDELENVGIVYEYNYVGDERTYRGLIAQDVEKRHPDCVVDFATAKGVRKAVNYARVGEKLLAA